MKISFFNSFRKPLLMAFFLFVFFFLVIPLVIRAQEKYEISADLVKIKRDRVKVTVKTPRVNADQVSWIMPAVIPGSYSRKDFGRFIARFKAYDGNGKKLQVSKEDNNVYTISNARGLSKIEYWVNDTWDARNDNFIFQPGGTNIDEGKAFVINHSGFWGYLDGYKILPYEITIWKPDSLFGSSALEIKQETPGKDIIYARDYVKLVDSPVMYCVPDTVSFMSGNTKIIVSVYSEGGIVKANKVKDYLVPLAASLTSFFGQMPVDRYYFLMYFPQDEKSKITKYGGYGALEHSYSSFYFLPLVNSEERLKSMILSIASHEFLHILTPLNIHSEEIGDFNFRNPEMSQHLWMYEGVTEYFSSLVQVNNKLISYEDFQAEMMEKIGNAAQYPDVSFTEMSKNILSEQYKDMYSNVYNKGALLGFLLDIKIHELSNGKKGLKDVMLELSAKYGPDKPFKDDTLIDEIISMTYPEIKHFFDDHIIGNKPLPYEAYLDKIGWKYIESREDSMKTFGRISFTYDSKRDVFLVIKSASSDNVFGLKNGDVILAVNDTPVTRLNYNELLIPIVATKGAGEIRVQYKRGKDTVSVKAKPLSVPIEIKHIIETVADPSESQLLLRKAMLNHNR